MKKCILLLIAITLSGTLFAQEFEKVKKDFGKRNIVSVSMGIWERCVLGRATYFSHKVGPAGALEYERVMSNYIRLKGRLFGGGIYNNKYQELQRHLGLSASVVVVPFGKKFKNLQLSLGGAYLATEVSYQDYEYTTKISSLGALEFAFKFNFVDNDKWQLGAVWNFQYTFNKNGSGFFTDSPMLSFGLKF